MRRLKSWSPIISLFVVACGGSAGAPLQTAMTPGGKADQGISPAAPATLLFSRDDRPVDGALVELRIEAKGEGRYDASLRTALFDRINGQERDETEVIARGLACAMDDVGVACTRDDMPVDGVLRELKVQPNDRGTFDATLRTAYFDRIPGKLVDQTETVATDLSPHPLEVVYLRDDMPVDGARVSLHLRRNDGGSFDVTLNTAYFDRIRGELVEASDELADDLACTFGAEVSCVRDRMPVDGALVELRIFDNGDSAFDATLRIAYIDRITGQLVDETKALAAGLRPVS